jgi:hypothetical protein
MNNVNTPIRVAAFAVAAVVVSGSAFALGSYSNAKYAAALEASDGYSVTNPSQTAIAPSRIDVFGKRSARTAA